jgi:hypothetical protein
VAAVRRRSPGETSITFALRDPCWSDLEIELKGDGADTRLRIRALDPTGRGSEVGGWAVAAFVRGRPEPVTATTHADGRAVLAGITTGALAGAQLMLRPPSLEAAARWSAAAVELLAPAAEGSDLPRVGSNALYERFETPLPDTVVEVHEGQIRFDQDARRLSIPLELKDANGRPDRRYVGRTLLMISNVGQGRGTTLAALRLADFSGTMLVDVDDDALFPLLRSRGVAGLRGLTSWVRFVLGADEPGVATLEHR